MDDHGRNETSPSATARPAFPRAAVLLLGAAFLVWALSDVWSLASRQGFVQSALLVALALIGLRLITAGLRGAKQASGRDRALSRVVFAAGVVLLALALGMFLFFPTEW